MATGPAGGGDCTLIDMRGRRSVFSTGHKPSAHLQLSTHLSTQCITDNLKGFSHTLPSLLPSFLKQ